MVSVDRLSFGVVDDLQISHALETDAIQVLRAVVPDDVGGGTRTRRRPVLDLLDLAPSAVAAVLVLPLPVDAADDAGPREDASDRDLLALAPGLEEDALATGGRDAVETVPELVLVAVVADRAEVVVAAFGALPADACRKRTVIQHVYTRKSTKLFSV